MKILFISNLYPNVHEPARGTFNRVRLAYWRQLLEVQIIAPISWFFIKGKYAPPASVPSFEQIDGLDVYHPRAFYLPKLFRIINPSLFTLSIGRLVRRIQREFDFDQIHVDWLYPDACGVANLARQLKVPFTVSVAGTDANLYLTYQVRRYQILRALRQASAIIVRSNALRTYSCNMESLLVNCLRFIMALIATCIIRFLRLKLVHA